MEKEKNIVEDFSAGDRLSELPDSLIFDIFSFLRMTDVVRTTILSTRWRNLWTAVSYLNFEDEENVSTDKVINFINGALNSWRGIKIVRFKLDFICKHEMSIVSDHIDSWMRFAVEKQVEELELYFPNRSDVSDVIGLYMLPQCVYSCSSLKVICFTSCELQINGNVQWDQLESLNIDGETLSEDAVNLILAGSPRLELLSLTFTESNEDLNIRSISLKEMAIQKFLLDRDGLPSMDTELRIWAPNLRTLEFKGVPYRKCFLMDVSSLSIVLLTFYGPGLFGHHVFHGNDFIGETLSLILPMIKHVESVALSNWSIKALRAMKDGDTFHCFPNVGYLKLNVCSQEYKQILGVLEMFPSLRVLALETTYNSLPKHIVESCVEYERSFSYFFPWKLMKIDVTWTKGDNSIFPLLEFLFKYSRKLEKMVFREKRTGSRTPWKSSFLALQKLARMPRSSPTAELIFC